MHTARDVTAVVAQPICDATAMVVHPICGVTAAVVHPVCGVTVLLVQQKLTKKCDNKDSQGPLNINGYWKLLS